MHLSSNKAASPERAGSLAVSLVLRRALDAVSIKFLG